MRRASRIDARSIAGATPRLGRPPQTRRELAGLRFAAPTQTDEAVDTRGSVVLVWPRVESEGGSRLTRGVNRGNFQGRRRGDRSARRGRRVREAWVFVPYVPRRWIARDGRVQAPRR